MTTAGDVGSATTGGTAPMVKVGVHAPIRRELPNKKQGKKKLKSFRELVKDNVSEEEIYIDSKLKKEFENIVEKLGGVRKAKKILNEKKIIESKSNQSIEDFVRSMGFKIKDEKPGIRTKEIVFFKEEDAQEAFVDLEGENYDKKYNITLKDKSIIYNI